MHNMLYKAISDTKQNADRLEWPTKLSYKLIISFGITNNEKKKKNLVFKIIHKLRRERHQGPTPKLTGRTHSLIPTILHSSKTMFRVSFDSIENAFGKAIYFVRRSVSRSLVFVEFVTWFNLKCNDTKSCFCSKLFSNFDSKVFEMIKLSSLHSDGI